MALQKKPKFDELICIRCGKTLKKNRRNFYSSRAPQYKHIGVIPICKDCVHAEFVNALKTQQDLRKATVHICKLLDKPFIEEVFQNSFKQNKGNPEDFYKIYIKNVSAGAYIKRGLITFQDSIFQDEIDEQQDEAINYDNVEVITPSTVEVQFPVSFEHFQLTDEIMARWGPGYTPEEYYCFERKYQILKNHYNQQTAMHTEALLTYIRYKVKAELATARNDVKAAKEWGMLADKAAQAAKINPVQLSKADLTGGLNTFGELARMVEQVDDIIPILPKFKKKPQDSVDFTIWCYVNYIRDLKGLPRVEHEEIYNYIEERKKEYQDKLDFLEAEEELIEEQEAIGEDIQDKAMDEAEAGDE